MDNAYGGGKDRRAAEELILRTVAAHAESLLRTARRHSLCLDDAQDAYQRALEIFMANADRLDSGRAAAWLHVVVKREAQAIRRSRQRLVTTDAVNLDEHEAPSIPTPEERLLSFDMLTRSAEALQRLKPHELRALWLKAQGHSYSDIGAITGWSYTKVNRCVAEGRRAFLERYAGIESGEECLRWRAVISAMVDGEATPEQIVDARPHLRNCPGCRATLKVLQESQQPLAALLPVPFVVLETDAGEQVSNLIMRIYETIAGGIHERAVHSVTKAQLAIEAATSGKIAAVAASAAAAAGGGIATVERTVGSAVDNHSAKVHHAAARSVEQPAGTTTPALEPPLESRVETRTETVSTPAEGTPAQPEPPASPPPPQAASEFDVEPQERPRRLELAQSGPPQADVTRRRARAASSGASEFAPTSGGEFGP